MSEVKTNKVSPVGANGTITLGDSGDTITIPSGATIANSGTATGFGSDNSAAFQALLSTNQQVTDNTRTKVQCTTESFDTDSAYDNSTNYRFTVPAGKGGKYYVYGQIWFFSTHGGNDLIEQRVDITKNGSTQIAGARNHRNSMGVYETVNCSIIADLSAGDYIEMFGTFNNAQAGSYPHFQASSTGEGTLFGAYKMIGI